MSDQPNPSRQRSRAALLLTGVSLGAFAACGYKPGSAPVTWSLAPATLDSFEEAGVHPSAQAHLEGALTLLYGDGENPRFLQTEQMLDDEFYPNDGGVSELSEEDLRDLVRDNRVRRFKRQLLLIEQGRFSEVPEPLYAPDLWGAWQREFAALHSPEQFVLAAGLAEDEEAPEPVSGDDPHPEPYYSTADNLLWLDEPIEEPTWAQEAEALFATWYPTLNESAEMYRQQCHHCHGPEGGGDGPTAPYLVPRPRDYRQGKFKRVSVERNGRPTRHDLYVILNEGIYGSAMPNFKRFSRGELEGLVDYVRLLSQRGESENLLAGATINSDSGGVPMEEVDETYGLVWEKWNEAPDKIINIDGDVPRPEDMTPERIEHGRELFMGTVANCYTCHGEDGRGNGASAWEEVAITDEDGNEVIESRRRLDEWGNDTLPRNFRLGEFRFGSRPIDIYRRIKVGISGTIMPAADPSLTDDDIWDMVYYVKDMANQYDIARVTEAKEAAIRARHAEEAHGHDHEAHDGDGHDGDGDHEDHGDEN